MAATVTEIDVINKALLLLGDRQITDRTENSERAKIMDAIYDNVRDKLLRECQWNFATTQKSIAQDASYTVVFSEEFDAAHHLPADFLYMVRVEGDVQYKMLDNRILVNEVSDGAALKIEYVKRVTDMSVADPFFVDALAYRLAYEACERITQSNTKKSDLAAEYELSITRAKRHNGQEDFPQDTVEDEWLTARY